MAHITGQFSELLSTLHTEGSGRTLLTDLHDVVRGFPLRVERPSWKKMINGWSDHYEIQQLCQTDVRDDFQKDCQRALKI